MKTGKYVLTILASIFSSITFAQNFKTVELQPILAQGNRYYYNLKKVHSAYALQIPLQAVNDDDVNKRFKRYTTYQRIRGIGYLVSLIYLFTDASYSQSSGETFLILLGTGVLLDFSLHQASHYQVRKAVDKYNMLIHRGKTGASLYSTPESIGFNFAYKF